jgi:hypothetical protein
VRSPLAHQNSSPARLHELRLDLVALSLVWTTSKGILPRLRPTSPSRACPRRTALGRDFGPHPLHESARVGDVLWHAHPSSQCVTTNGRLMGRLAADRHGDRRSPRFARRRCAVDSTARYESSSISEMWVSGPCGWMVRYVPPLQWQPLRFWLSHPVVVLPLLSLAWFNPERIASTIALSLMLVGWGAWGAVATARPRRARVPRPEPTPVDRRSAATQQVALVSADATKTKGMS